MVDVTNKSDLIEALQKIISNYEDVIKWKSGKVPSTQDIATEVGILYPTINNIKKGTAKYISHEMVAKISTKLGGPLTIAEILKFAESQKCALSDDLKEEYGDMVKNGYIMENYCPRTREFMDIALQEKYMLILESAYSFSGITEEEIFQNLGPKGKANLNFLVEKNMLVKKDGRYFGKTQGVALSKREHVIKCVQVLARIYGENEDKSINRISFQTKSLNKRGKKKISEKLEEVFMFINEEAKKPENIGEEKVAIGMIAYKFFENPNDSNNNEKEMKQ